MLRILDLATERFGLHAEIGHNEKGVVPETTPCRKLASRKRLAGGYVGADRFSSQGSGHPKEFRDDRRPVGRLRPNHRL